MTDYTDLCRQFREHVNITERNSDAARISFDAIDGFERISKTGISSKEDLNVIRQAMVDPHRGPWNIGIDLMSLLSDKYPEAEGIFRELGASKRAHERWVAISAIRCNGMSEKLAFDLIRNALYDPSPKIRIFAVDGIFFWHFDSLLPALQEMAAAEKNGKVLNSIHFVMEHIHPSA